MSNKLLYIAKSRKNTIMDKAYEPEKEIEKLQFGNKYDITAKYRFDIAEQTPKKILGLLGLAFNEYRINGNHFSPELTRETIETYMLEHGINAIRVDNNDGMCIVFDDPVINEINVKTFLDPRMTNLSSREKYIFGLIQKFCNYDNRKKFSNFTLRNKYRREIIKTLGIEKGNYERTLNSCLFNLCKKNFIKRINHGVYCIV